MSARAGGSNHACAACKHQRRRCVPECVLARYFPAENTQQFLDVHRLFGVSNLLRIYDTVPLPFRDQSMETMIYEAEMRRNDPVHGCCGLIRQLTAEIDATRRELDVTRHQILHCERLQLLQQQSDNREMKKNVDDSKPFNQLLQDLNEYKDPSCGIKA